MEAKSRIKKLENLRPSQIVTNPKNWRTHPHAQREALGGLISEIGIVNTCIVRPIGDGKYMLIDGHLRADVLSDNDKIPCIILDVNEQEADKILLSLDPLSAMAELSPEKLNALLDSVDISADALKSLAENLRYQAETFSIPAPSSPTEPANNPADEWKGMPEFDHEDLSPFRTIHVHFRDQESVDKFFILHPEYKITEKTKFVWFPEQEKEVFHDKRYVGES